MLIAMAMASLATPPRPKPNWTNTFWSANHIVWGFPSSRWWVEEAMGLSVILVPDSSDKTGTWLSLVRVPVHTDKFMLRFVFASQTWICTPHSGRCSMSTRPRWIFNMMHPCIENMCRQCTVQEMVSVQILLRFLQFSNEFNHFKG